MTIEPVALVGPAISALIAVVAVVATLIGARRLGLTDLQRAVDQETDRLITTLRARVEYLEVENTEQKRHIVLLEGRIDELETAIVKRATRG